MSKIHPVLPSTRVAAMAATSGSVMLARIAPHDQPGIGSGGAAQGCRRARNNPSPHGRDGAQLIHNEPSQAPPEPSI